MLLQIKAELSVSPPAVTPANAPDRTELAGGREGGSSKSPFFF